MLKEVIQKISILKLGSLILLVIMIITGGIIFSKEEDPSWGGVAVIAVTGLSILGLVLDWIIHQLAFYFFEKKYGRPKVRFIINLILIPFVLYFLVTILSDFY